MSKILKLIRFYWLLMLPLSINAQPVSFNFDFGNGKVKKGYTQVNGSTAYTKENGYGFLSSEGLKETNYKSKNALTTDFISSDHPFYFTVDVPEGNYNVKVYLGDEEGMSSTMIRAECRRLMLQSVETEKGVIATKEFTVHIRNKYINSNMDSVRLKPREYNYLHWDNQLTLELTGHNPKVCAIEIIQNTKPITLFLAGNSTVVDQAEEPYAAWGQMIPTFFKSGNVAIANYAESGETLKSFMAEKRLAKVFSMMRSGDYLFIEFAHNDQKPGGNHLDPYTTYKETLKYYIDETRKRQCTPVLVTSMHRRNFDEQGKIINTLEDYPEAVRQTGQEEGVVVLDLNAQSKILYETWGPAKSLHAFVHYPANTFPGQLKELADNTHFNPYGAYELAKCIVNEIKTSRLPISDQLIDNLPAFDPSHPDLYENWYWPLSVQRKPATKPDGN